MTFHTFIPDTQCGGPIANEWCQQKYPHIHSRACDSTCPCNTPTNDPNYYPPKEFA